MSWEEQAKIKIKLITGDWEVSGTLGQIDAIERAASLFPADHDPDQLLAFVLSERSERRRVDAAQAPKGGDSDAMTPEDLDPRPKS